MTNNHCNNPSACGCAGLSGDEDEFYDFSTPAKVEEKPKMREILHPKNDEELRAILASIPEHGGVKSGDEPTSHGDWAHKGKVVDF